MELEVTASSNTEEEYEVVTSEEVVQRPVEVEIEFEATATATRTAAGS